MSSGRWGRFRKKCHKAIVNESHLCSLVFTVVVMSIHVAGCIKQNDQLHTLSNNDLVGSDCPKTMRDVIIPPYQNVSESITVNKVFNWVSFTCTHTLKLTDPPSNTCIGPHPHM